MRLIDADALIKRMPSVMDMQDVYLPIHLKDLLIDEAPTIDAVPVIRCKDCKFYSGFLGANPHYHLCERFDAYRKADEFCSRAERKKE